VIGVIPKANEHQVVEEFFQLFKTPWEFYREGRHYEVVIITGEQVAQVDADLVVVYGAELQPSDRLAGLISSSPRQGASLNWGASQIPLYRETLTFESDGRPAICHTSKAEIAGLEVEMPDRKGVRIGYGLFAEVEFLLTKGQPVENAHLPTLELHIALLRELIVGANISLVEVAPAPAGYDFAVCLTHDIDFVGIRRHKFDHTMWGFLYRSTVGALREFSRKRISPGRLLSSLKAAAALPLVYLGWLKDFWIPFEWYLKVEKDLSPTYFFIPFKHRAGEKVSASHPERRASAYDISDIPEWTERLAVEGCEIGVHGIDAWHSVEKAREELQRVSRASGCLATGIRMHWLLRDENTYRVLEEAGYAYDSTAGYNEAPGYRCGTTQAFRPLSASSLLELPMHIQDGALFFAQRLGLTEPEAWARCQVFIENARKFGGVLTVLWHDRSPGPERFWGEFYIRLVEKLKSVGVWFATASQAVGWFRNRRQVAFELVAAEDGSPRVKLCGLGHSIMPPLRVRIYSPGAESPTAREMKVGRPQITDFSWDGRDDLKLKPGSRLATHPPAEILPVPTAA
jgi:hypothetical protein